MEPSSNVSSLVDAPARLSSAQKRDLVGQALAAVITTALIAAPLVAPIDAVLPAQSFAGPVMAVAFDDAQASRALPSAVRPAVQAKPRPAGRLSTTPLSGVAVQPMLVATSGNLRATPESARKPLSRRLTGWLVGDGTHSIRPFPSVTVAAVRP